MASGKNPQTPGTKYRDVDGVIRTYNAPKVSAPSSAPSQLPDDIFASGGQENVQRIAGQLPDYDKYLRQFSMEDFDTAQKRLDEDYNRYVSLSKETEETGLAQRNKNYGGSVRRASVGYIQRGILTPGKSGIINNDTRERREGYTQDVDLFKRGMEIQRETQKTQYDRSKQDIQTGQRRNTVTELAGLNNALFQ